MTPDADRAGVRQGRVAANEEAFRRENAHVRGRLERFLPWRLECASYVCECSDGACTVRIELSDREYRHARATARRFVIAPEHNTTGQERVIERHDRYWLVEKPPAAPEER